MKYLRFPVCFYFLIIIIAIFYSAAFAEYGSKKNKTITIQFHHYAGNALLTLDTSNYKNNLGQLFTVTKFKYYISNITLIEQDNSELKLQGYYLVNEEESNTKKINIQNTSEKNYSAIKFTIGVDSIHNCSGIQSGDLDPLKGMFWAWNTGYIFLKLEGNSPQSKTPGHNFEYHIGGFMEPNNCIRKVTLNLSHHLISATKENQMINIKVDISEILKNPIDIDFLKLPVVTDFHNATKIADNYQDMFSIIDAK